MSTAIVGIGRTEYTRNSGRTTLAMAAEASRLALADAGLPASRVRGIIDFQFADSTGPLEVARALGISELPWYVDMSAGGQAVATMVRTASAAVESGLADVVIMYRSLNGRSGYRFGTASSDRRYTGPAQFTAPHGYIVPPEWLAMWTRRHMHTYGTRAEDLGAIAVTQRAHAVPNTHAIARDPLTLDQYLDSRVVFDPFRLYDCTFEVDGAVAIVIASEEVAADTAKAPVWIRGSIDAHGTTGWDQWPDMTEMYSAKAGPRLWNETGLRPEDIDVACMYDCFTYTVLATLEGYGFCKPGEVGDFFRDGRATYGGDVVVNPHGGLLSEGYIHGLNHHYEAALQLRGEAGVRQVENARTALATAGAGPFGGAVIYGKDKP
ncbi:nonspecific lipid-transfer protein [Rhodococcus sp. NPDC003318]|uniref:thiolase C-terminal domain-containing protein n=1 Tax=Rhodococcus sp. NPDC003318 TaxID=3364503 RepID=UPI0036835E11